jgi:thioredoxin-related protein
MALKEERSSCKFCQSVKTPFGRVPELQDAFEEKRTIL